jgi:hypothetical protein
MGIDAGANYHIDNQLQCWYICAMNRLKKITVEVPENDLTLARKYTGKGVTETVRAALKKLASMQAQHELSKLRGTVKFAMTLDELRYDRE